MMSLFPYQKENIEFLTTRKKVLLADDMGYGKTRSVLHSIVSTPALIICPKPVIPEWLHEIRLHNTFSVTTQHWETGYDLYLLNYERLLNPRHFQQINSLPFRTIVLDECHRIRNPQTQIHQLVCRLHDCPYRYALSGTPLVNRVEDVLSVFDFLQIKEVPRFLNRKAIFGIPVKPRWMVKTALFKQLLKKYVIRHDKELVTALPDLSLESIAIPYDESHCTETYQNISKHKPEQWYRGIFQHLRQEACNNVEKLDWVQRFLNAHPEANVVVFADFLEILRRLYSHYPLANVITGEEKVWTGDRLLLCSKAGDHGLNLQQFQVMLNLSPPLTYASLIQRYKRIYRLGQEEPCQIINVVSERSVEEYIYQSIIRRKRIMAKKYIGEYLQHADGAGL